MRKREEIENLFEAIKSDDVEVFSCHFLSEEDYKISFGRFPILSVCYLYNSKKIIKKFEENFTKIYEYEKHYEPLEIFDRFKKVAKKSIRKFVLKPDIIISPIEMLAVLGKTRKMQKMYKNALKNSEIDENFEKNLVLAQKILWDTYNQNMVIMSGKRLVFYNRPLNYFDKKLLINLAYTFIISALISIIISTFIFIYFGDGNIVKINSETQFKMAIEGGKSNCVLCDNFEFEEFYVSEFSGTLDGNFKTIKIKNKTQKPILENLNGTIKNLNIIFENEEISITNSGALFLSKNNGKLNNVTLTFNTKFYNDSVMEEEVKEIFFSAFSYENNGEISNCTFVSNSNLSVRSEESKSLTFSIFSKQNNGTILNSKTNGKINSLCVDFSGFTYLNSQGAKIENCTNNIEVLQSVDSDNWSPFIFGIAKENNGEITNAVNNSNLIAELSTEEEVSVIISGIAYYSNGTVQDCVNNGDIMVNTKNASVYIGGILYKNDGYVVHCKNQSNISVVSNGSEIYVGGIVMHIDLGIVRDSISESDISVVTEVEDNFIAVGGITAVAFPSNAYYYYYLTSYYVENCCSVSTYYTTNKHALVGLIAGLTFNNYVNNCVALKDYNATLEDIARYGTANLLTLSFSKIVRTNYCTNNGVTIYETLDELKSAGGYW